MWQMVYDKVEEKEVNAASRELKMAGCACTAGTCSVSCGTGDRTGNNKNYIEAALAILTLSRCGNRRVRGEPQAWRRKARALQAPTAGQQVAALLSSVEDHADMRVRGLARECMLWHGSGWLALVLDGGRSFTPGGP